MNENVWNERLADLERIKQQYDESSQICVAVTNTAKEAVARAESACRVYESLTAGWERDIAAARRNTGWAVAYGISMTGVAILLFAYILQHN